MLDIFTTIMKLIQSPPGQLAAGGVLAGIVWKCFEHVESVLTDATKFEIAVWLVGLNAEEKVPWPETFAKVFDRVFGEKHLSWKCFWRSSAISLVLSFILLIVRNRSYLPHLPSRGFLLAMQLPISNILPDYLCLLVTRNCLRLPTFSHAVWVQMSVLACDAIFTVYFLQLSFLVSLLTSLWAVELLAGFKPFADLFVRYYHGDLLYSGEEMMRFHLPMLSNPVLWMRDFWFHLLQAPYLYIGGLFALLWVVLYVGSGTLLKAAKRFDIGFQWFNSKVDIERKPLSAIGLVAGALVAIVYWSFVIAASVTTGFSRL